MFDLLINIESAIHLLKQARFPLGRKSSQIEGFSAV